MDSRIELVLGAAWKRMTGSDPYHKVFGTICGSGCHAGLQLPLEGTWMLLSAKLWNVLEPAWLNSTR